MQRLPAVGHGGGLQRLVERSAAPARAALHRRCARERHAGRPAMTPAAIARALAETCWPMRSEVAAPEEDKSVDPKTFAAFVGRYDYKARS